MVTVVNNKSIRVLLVENNPGDARLVQEILQEDSPDQFALICVERLTDAVTQLAQKDSIDVILLDLSLSDGSGLGSLTRIRTEAPYLPIVILTGNNDAMLALEVIRAGAQDYLLKRNLDSHILKRVLRDAIERKRVDQAQRDSDERFRALVQHSTDVITILSADGMVIYESPSLERVMGYRPESVQGLNIREVIHPDDLPSVLAGMLTILNEPATAFSCEVRLRHADGSWRIQETTMTNLLDQPAIQGIVINSRDITGRRQNEEAIRFQAQLLNTVGQALIATDMDNKIIYWNRSAEKLYGWSESEALGGAIADLTNADSSQEQAVEIMSHLRAGESWHGEFMVKNKAGNAFPVLVTDTPIMDQKGVQVGIIGASIDISERKRAEEALVQSEQLLRVVLEKLPVAVWLYDAQGKITHGNPAGHEIWAGAKYVGLEQFGVYKGWRVDTQQPIKAQDWAAARVFTRGETSLNEEIEIECFDGTHKFILNSALPLLNEEGEITGAISLNQDITERKRAEEALKQSEQRFQSLFEHAPLSLWVMDYSGTKRCLDEIRAEGVRDFDAYFEQYPEALEECIAGLQILDVNRASLALYHAPDQETFRQNFRRTPLGGTQGVARHFLAAIANGQTFYNVESVDWTLDGKPIDVDVTWSVIPGFEGTLEKIIRSAVDITERKRVEQKLQQSEQHFRSLFENSPLSLWEQDYSATKHFLDTLHAQGITDFETYFEQYPQALHECVAGVRTLNVNQATLVLYRAPDQAALLQNGTRFLTDSRAARTRHFLAAVAAGQTSYHTETVNETVDGRLIDLDVTWTVVPGFEDTFAKVIRSVVDISEHKRAEHELQQYNRRLAVLHTIDRSILKAESSYKIAAMVAEKLTELLACDRIRIISIDARDNSLTYIAALPPASPESQMLFRETVGNYGFPESFRQGKALLIDDLTNPSDLWVGFEATLRQGQTRSWMLVPLIADAQLIGMVVAGSDQPAAFTAEHFNITCEVADQLAIALHNQHLDQQIQEHAYMLETRVHERTEQLRLVKERSEAILMNASDAMLVAQPDGSIEQVNTAFTALFGYSLAQTQTISLFSLLDSNSIALVRRTLNEIVAGVQTKRVELVGLRQDGTLFEAEAALSCVNRQPTTLICSIRDITLRKRAEEEMRQALAHEKELNELKTRFVSMVSHDFRTPLASILSSSDLLRNYSHRMTDERKQKHFETIQLQISHLTDLLEDMLTLTKAESVGMEFNPILTDLQGFCQTLVDEIQPLSGTHSIRLLVEGEVEWYPLDPQLLRRALVNLLTNAVKYSPEDSAIELTVSCETGRIVLRIQDHGIGIPEADQARLFEVFHRARNVGDIPGTGLGLVIVKLAVEAHGGTITLDSQVNIGTAVTISLPLSLAEAETS